MQIHYISNEHLSLERVEEVVYGDFKIALSSETKERIIKCREYLDRKIEQSTQPIYGITTGFGSLCNVSIEPEQLSQLQCNLVMSHACGVGDEVRESIVRIITLLKIQSLSYGYSGVMLETVERLVDFFNNRIVPVIYEQGSLGASGDLAPLAHLSLPLLGLGEVDFNGERISGARLNEIMGWKPIDLKSKEGLALLNGTQFMSGYAVWSLINARRLINISNMVSALSLEGYDGCTEAFCEAVHRVRPHKGQIAIAKAIRDILEGSEIATPCKSHVQDPYSFRCIPQVHGAMYDTIEYVKSVITIEINSATDNPTVLPDDDLIVSAGNFHGEPLAFVLDNLAIAMSELASISGQRIYQLISGRRGLPKYLVAIPGVNSGFMIPQYVVASIISQNKQLCTPASVDTIESSLGQEDHVSMGGNAATKCARVMENVWKVVAIELMNGAQALDFRRPLKSSVKIETFFSDYRKVVTFVECDRVMYLDINRSIEFVKGFQK